MASVSITSPATNSVPFPDPVAGTYSSGAGDVVVEVKNERGGAATTHTATAASGSWSLPRPGSVSHGNKYTITAFYSGESDVKTGITG